MDYKSYFNNPSQDQEDIEQSYVVQQSKSQRSFHPTGKGIGSGYTSNLKTKKVKNEDSATKVKRHWDSIF